MMTKMQRGTTSEMDCSLTKSAIKFHGFILECIFFLKLRFYETRTKLIQKKELKPWEKQLSNLCTMMHELGHLNAKSKNL